MASFEVIPVEQNSSGSFGSGEYSFLPEVSGPRCQNGVGIHVNGTFDLTNMASSIAIATPDHSVEEINLRLSEISEENRSLKDALDKNNSLMKDQMSTISAWRDHMILSKTQLEQNLNVAKDKISALEKENADLSEKLHNLEQAYVLTNQPCKNCKNLETVLQSLHEENMSVETSKKVLAEELGGMAQFQEQFRQNLLTIYNQLHSLLRPSFKIPEKDKMELKALIQCLGTKIGILGGDFGAISQTDEETGYVVINKKVDQVSDYLPQGSSEMESLKEVLEEKNTELEIFRKREKQMSEIIKSYEMRLEEIESQQKSKFDLLNNKLQIESSLSEKYKERCESLQQHNEEYQVKLDQAKMSDDHRLEQLKEEAKNLQEILKLEQRANQKDKDKIAEVMEKCEKLQVDYDRVIQLLEIQSKDEKIKHEELRTLRDKNEKEYMEKVDHLTAQLFELEDKLADKCDEVTKLKEHMDSISEESETIPILKAQVESYKTDLEHAVRTRDTAHAEIDHLEKELKKYKRPDSDHGATGRRKSSHSHKKDASQTGNFTCPSCFMAFTTTDALQNHYDIHHMENLT